MQSINPATGELIAVYPDHTPAEVDAALELATGAFTDWRRTSFADRSAHMSALAELLDEHTEDWARLMTLETGKPIAEARAEIEKCAWVSRYYAAEAESILADRAIEAGRTRSYVHHEPLGPVLAVMPWNFPFWQVFRFAAPALMAGNVGVLSPAPTVSGCGIA
ncbi:MAG: aldehyde dehydrogenase family protein, partial [Acidimicrobiia bacterium]|nr:aldehyde dehydrogenase family protein [Acidimicrobiia bacterium]